MSKTIFNFWLDVTLLVLFLTLGWISAVLQFVFPVGPRAFECQLWGWDYLVWRDLQFGILCLFALGILLHIMMHWTWCCSIVTRRMLKQSKLPDHGMQTIYGVILLAALLHFLGIAFGLAMFTIQGVSAE